MKCILLQRGLPRHHAMFFIKLYLKWAKVQVPRGLPCPSWTGGCCNTLYTRSNHRSLRGAWLRACIVHPHAVAKGVQGDMHACCKVARWELRTHAHAWSCQVLLLSPSLRCTLEGLQGNMELHDGASLRNSAKCQHWWGIREAVCLGHGHTSGS